MMLKGGRALCYNGNGSGKGRGKEMMLKGKWIQMNGKNGRRKGRGKGIRQKRVGADGRQEIEGEKKEERN